MEPGEVAMAARTGSAVDPIAKFCAALKQLRTDSGHNPQALARQLNISRAQLYAILNGEIKRPPDWTRFVGPLVEACTGGDTRAVADWRQRHTILVEVCEELNRQRRRTPPAADPGKEKPAGQITDARLAAGAAKGREDPVPRQLPAHTPYFVGREDELRALDGLLDEAATARPGPGRAAGTVTILAIVGTAGIGKTTLALRWAHRVAGQFPDGQIYVNLRGFDPARPPMEPAEAVRGFLEALGVEPARVPGDLDSQGALYRSLLAQRRLLVLLDNARDSEQVRPLLPGSETCVAIVTSRNQVSGLIAREGAHQISLDLLGTGEARQLLTRHMGSNRVAREPDAVDELACLCARLPLALSIVAARAAAQPAFSLARFADELRDVRERLDALDAGELATNVRAVLSWSYEQLDPAAARVFRLLGIHPGPDISLHAAASLAGLDRKQARSAMAALVQACLVTEHLPGRFAFHDLLRAYATEQADSLESSADRRVAIQRVLDHYLHTGRTAALLLEPPREPIPEEPIIPGVRPENIGDYGKALAWFEAEHPVLLAIVDLAHDEGLDIYAWQIPWTMATFLDRTGQWHDYAATQRIALAAAQRLGDRTGQGLAHRGIGRSYARRGFYEDARLHYESAIELHSALGDRIGQARTLLALSWVFERQGSPGAALDHAQHALALYQELDHRPGQAEALNTVGWYHGLHGNYAQSLICCQQALNLSRELKNRFGEANTWDSLGYAHHHLGQFQDAVDCYQKALKLYRELGDGYIEADTLTHLGDTYIAAGERGNAEQAWQLALTILDELGNPEADTIRARLHDLRNTDTPQPG
jgi:tetratricopeptide (TPR) repeat protein